MYIKDRIIELAVLAGVASAVLVACISPAESHDETDFRKCMSHDRAVKYLAAQFGEHPVYRGWDGDMNRVVEVWYSIKTQTFTVTATDEANVTCQLSSGTHLQKLLHPDTEGS